MDTTPCLKEGCGVWRGGVAGAETQQGEGRWGTGAERDRWMDTAKREEDCEGGTDGAQKGDGSRGGNGRLRKERD